MNPFAVCIFAISAVCLISVLRQTHSQLANIATAVAGIAVFVYIIKGIVPFAEFVGDITEATGMDTYFSTMLKALAVSFCCKMCGDICRDCGENSLASKVELAGKAGIVIISLPMVESLLGVARDMLT